MLLRSPQVIPIVGLSNTGASASCKGLRSNGVLKSSACSCSNCVSSAETAAAFTSFAGAFCLLRFLFLFRLRLRPLFSESLCCSLAGPTSLDALASSLGLRFLFLFRFLLRLRFLLFPSRPSPLFSLFGAFSLLSLISSCLRNQIIDERQYQCHLQLGSQLSYQGVLVQRYQGGYMGNL